MRVQANDYGNGLYSLIVFDDNDVKLSGQGTALRGEYDFGISDDTEEVRVTFGTIRIGEETYGPGTESRLIFRKGEPIKFTVLSCYADYRSVYNPT